MSASGTATTLPSAAGSLSLPQFAAAALFLAASSCVAVRCPHLVAPGAEEEEDQGTTTVLSTVLPPLADAVELLLKPRQLFILHRFHASRGPTQSAPSDHSLHFFDAHTLKPVLGMQKPCRLPESLNSQFDSCYLPHAFDSCYLPHAFGRNKPALVVATSSDCDASAAFGWAPTIFVLDEHFNCIKPLPARAASQAPDVACSVCPHPSDPSVVLCASESMHCVTCLNVASAEWSRFSASFPSMDAITALPSCGLLAVGSYSNDRIAVCDLDSPPADVDCGRFEDKQTDVCGTMFAPLGDRYFVCMLSWGIGVYNALMREQIDFFPLDPEDTRSCGCGGLVKALEVPHEQKSITLGLFIVFHRDLLQIVRCDHHLQWSVVNNVDGGPLLEALKGDGYEVEFFAII